MTTENQDAKSYGVTFTKKVSDGSYGGEEISFWVSADVEPGATAEQKYDALQDAANIAKAAVYDHFKIEVTTDEQGIIREAVKRVERAFPGTQEVPGQQASPTSSGTTTVRVKGKQFAELPTWLIEACARDGVTEVYDNRPVEGNRPHFKPTTPTIGSNGKEIAYWPPKGR